LAPPAADLFVRPTPVVEDVPRAAGAEGAEGASEAKGASWRTIALRVGATLVVVALITLAVRRMDIAALRGALESAGLAPLLLASLFSLTMLVAKAAYWKTIVSPVARVPVRTMLWYEVSALGASLVLPMRGGEAVRIYWLRKRHDVPLSVIGAALGFEKISDVTSLVLLVLPLPWLFPKETWLGRLQVIAAVLLVAIVVAVVLAQRARRSFAWVARLRIFDTPRTTLTAYACVLTSWVADATLILVVMHSLGLPMHVSSALLVLLAANVAIAIPTAPGNVGALELGVAFALTRLGVPSERAAAFAILYHGVQLATLLTVWALGTGFEAIFGSRSRTVVRS
jgi:uncharacterized membrane protein YbhN (UPF0104 family)